MRTSGRARIKLASGAEYEVGLAALDFVFRQTWEPSLVVVGIYGIELILGQQAVSLELHDIETATSTSLSVRVGVGCSSGAKVVEQSGLGRLSDGAPVPAVSVVEVPPQSKEERFAAYQLACEVVADEARAAALNTPKDRDVIVLAAVERIAQITRPEGGPTYTEVVRCLFHDTGYYETEVITLPAGLSAAAIVAVMLRFGVGGRGVYVLDADRKHRQSCKERPADLEGIDGADVWRVVIRTQFSTGRPGGTEPGIWYDRDGGGFVFDGPGAARDAYRATVTAALQAEAAA